MKKIKDNFDKNALPHKFAINDLVWYEDFAPLGKDAKLTPKGKAQPKSLKSMIQTLGSCYLMEKQKL